MTRARLLLMAMVALASPALAASDVSPAEEMLFLTNNLAGLKPPATLRYRFSETGAAEEGLVLSFQARDDGGCCKVQPAGTGAAFRPLPLEIEGAANPVSLLFLERDLRWMQANTGGQRNYFRRLIRTALADSAKITDTKVRWRGADVAAREILVEPYKNDPGNGRYERFADKSYVFVLSEAAPGGVYQIRTATAGGSAPVETVLTLQEDAQ